MEKDKDKISEENNLDEIRTIGYYQVDKEINIKPIFPPKVSISYIDTFNDPNSESLKMAEETARISEKLLDSVGVPIIRMNDFNFIGDADLSARRDIEKQGIILTSTPKGVGYFDMLSVSNKIKSETVEMVETGVRGQLNPFLSARGDISMMLDFLIKQSMFDLDQISVDYEKWKSDIREVWKSTVYLPRKQKKRVRKELRIDWNNACQGNKLQIKYFPDILKEITTKHSTDNGEN